MYTILVLVIYIAILIFCISNNILFFCFQGFGCYFWFLTNRRQNERIQKQKGNPGVGSPNLKIHSL